MTDVIRLYSKGYSDVVVPYFWNLFSEFKEEAEAFVDDKHSQYVQSLLSWLVGRGSEDRDSDESDQ